MVAGGPGPGGALGRGQGTLAAQARVRELAADLAGFMAAQVSTPPGRTRGRVLTPRRGGRGGTFCAASIAIRRSCSSNRYWHRVQGLADRRRGSRGPAAYTRPAAPRGTGVG